MNAPWLSLTLMGLGLIISMIATIALIIISFRRHVLWGLAVIFVPLASLVFVCLHWAEAKKSFIASLIGTAMVCIGLFSIPGMTEQFTKIAQAKYGHPGAEKKAPDLTAEIQEHRQRLETLQAAFVQDGVDLTKQYQTLDAQRKALKTADTAAVTKFNETAAAYQTRNAARKQMQVQIDTTQHELDALLDKRSRAAAAPGGKKVVMYSTTHCPACEAARQYFVRKGVHYEEINVEATRAAYEEFQKLGGHGVPLILVGDKRMDGFSALALDAALM